MSTEEPTHELGERLRVAVDRLNRRMREESMSGTPLTPSRMSALTSIATRGPIRLTDLAKVERVSKSSITRMVVGLSEMGFIQTLPDSTDGRSTLVDTTGAGRRVLAESTVRTDAFLAARIGGLSEAEQVMLSATVLLLERLGRRGSGAGRSSHGRTGRDPLPVEDASTRAAS